MALRVAVLFLLVATPAVYAAQHIVGGSTGWDTSGDYSTWAAGETFNAGDTLVFNYGGSHGVNVVSKDDYDNCNAANAIESHTGGKTTITLSKAGSMYFVCPTSFHCSQGMKLAVTVQGGSPGGSPPSGSTPTTPSTPSTPSNPSGSNTPSTTPSTPSSSGKSSPNSPNGAAGRFGSINHLMLGFSLVFAALVVRV